MFKKSAMSSHILISAVQTGWVSLGKHLLNGQLIMSTPLGGGHISFAFSAVRRPTWFPDILGNSSYPIFTKFGMQVYWVDSLYGIAFGDDSSVAN